VCDHEVLNFYAINRVACLGVCVSTLTCTTSLTGVRAVNRLML
jgi:hypothetical protein